MASSSPKVSKLRRRLTVGNETEGGAGTGAEGSNIDAKSLIQTLKDTDLVALADDKAGGGGGGGGRRGSVNLASKTDKNLSRRQSFEEKDHSVAGGANKAALKEAKDTVQKKGIGLVCKKGMKPESPNQDSFSILVTDKFNLYGVFDGHGPKGHDVSNFVVENLYKGILMEMDKENPDDSIHKALTTAFVNMQAMLESLTRNRTVDASMSGSTGTVVYQPLTGKKKIVVAWVGDSRAIMMSKKGEVTDLTVDHKPDIPKEKERIEKAGGKVVFDGYFNHRVFTKSGQGGLNMSRAFGDCVAHQAGVTAEPEIVEKPLVGDETLIICSDGVWEFLPSEDAGKIVKDASNQQDAAEKLSKTGYDLWIEDSEGEVADDITAIIVDSAKMY